MLVMIIIRLYQYFMAFYLPDLAVWPRRATWFVISHQCQGELLGLSPNHCPQFGKGSKTPVGSMNVQIRHLVAVEP